MKRKNSSRAFRKVLTTGLVISLVLTFVWGFLFYSSNNLVLARVEKPEYDISLSSIIYKNSFEPVHRAYEPKVINVKKGDIVYEVFTVKNDIREILSDYMIPIEDNERVTCSTPYVMDGSFIKLITTEVVTEVKELEIPFDTEVIKTDEYVVGEKIIAQEGVLGIKTQKVVKYYEDGELIDSELIEEIVKREPVNEIVEEGTAKYSLNDIEARGYNCNYWYGVVDSGPYTDDEKQWLKFVMKCESGCNAESNKHPVYKGLFQWSPYYWGKQYDENIFDGHAQIKHTVEKIRAGAHSMWPACTKKYNATYGTDLW